MFVFWTFMPDTKRIVVYYEGDDDKAVLEQSKALACLPAEWDIAKRSRDQHPGKDGLVDQLLPFIRPDAGVGGHAVVLIDLDDLSHAKIAEWFQARLTAALQHAGGAAVNLTATEAGRITSYRLKAGDREGRVVLVPVGLPEAADLRTEFGVDRFAIDDHVLNLVRNEGVYAAVSELKDVPHALAMKKLSEVAKLFRDNSLEVRHSKRYLQILRAVGGLRPGIAVIYERFVKNAGGALSPDEFRALLHPLLDDLDEAGRLLGS